VKLLITAVNTRMPSSARQAWLDLVVQLMPWLILIGDSHIVPTLRSCCDAIQGLVDRTFAEAKRGRLEIDCCYAGAEFDMLLSAIEKSLQLWCDAYDSDCKAAAADAAQAAAAKGTEVLGIFTFVKDVFTADNDSLTAEFEAGMDKVRN
jgi:hypothetical protein